MTDRMTNADIEAFCRLLEIAARPGGRGLNPKPAFFAQALTAIRQLQNPWMPIETADTDDIIIGKCPRYGVVVLEFWYGRWTAAIDTERCDFMNGPPLEDFEPTHWMPLPPAPETSS